MKAPAKCKDCGKDVFLPEIRIGSITERGCLSLYHWNGELRCGEVILGDIVKPSEIPSSPSNWNGSRKVCFKSVMISYQTELILWALKNTSSKVSAAKMLSLSATNLMQRIRRLGISTKVSYFVKTDTPKVRQLYPGQEGGVR